jgi:hypothetical protein
MYYGGAGTGAMVWCGVVVKVAQLGPIDSFWASKKVWPDHLPLDFCPTGSDHHHQQYN